MGDVSDTVTAVITIMTVVTTVMSKVACSGAAMTPQNSLAAMEGAYPLNMSAMV